MGTNKTRLYVYDMSSAIPYAIQAALEFDVYQEALNYAYAIVWETRQGIISFDNTLQVLVYSETNTCYRIQSRQGSTTPLVTEVDPPKFP